MYHTSDTIEHQATNQQKHVLPRRNHFDLMFQSDETNVGELTLVYL